MTRSEARHECRRLVTQEGWVYTDAAAATGVPLSTVQKWAAAEKWQATKGTTASYMDGVRQLKARMLAELLDGGAADPQKVFALKTLESAFPEHRYTKPEEDPRAKLGVGAEVIEQLVAYLGGNDRNTLTALQPHLVGFATHLEQTWAA